ncbi:MAG: PIN domain-containing protein, partial [Candidatus Micrarchaeia archaeon]
KYLKNDTLEALVIFVTKEGYDFIEQNTDNQIPVLFDSNSIDKIADETLSIDTLERSKAIGYAYYITHVQSDEISNTPDSKQEKRRLLTLFLAKVAPTIIPTESFVLGTSRLGHAKLGDAKILEELRKGKWKNTNDALIGETAIKNNMLLITNDEDFKKRVLALGGKALTCLEFQRLLS